MNGCGLPWNRRATPFFVASAVLVLMSLQNLAAQQKADADGAAAAERGRKQFEQSCAFCHGADATGARGPDLMRSPLVAHDVKGEQIGQVIRQGRPDKGMPAMPLNDSQMTFFSGAGGCDKCHSPSGDLAGIATKLSPMELEARMLYPGGKHKTAIVTLRSGEQVKGSVEHADDFVIAVRDENGWYRSFRRDSVKVELEDKLAAHRELLGKLTQADVHNLFAYLETLK